MTSDMKADTAQLKEPKQAKSQMPKKQHVPATEAAPKKPAGQKGWSRHVMVIGKIMADAQIFRIGHLLH